MIKDYTYPKCPCNKKTSIVTLRMIYIYKFDYCKREHKKQG